MPKVVLLVDFAMCKCCAYEEQVGAERRVDVAGHWFSHRTVALQVNDGPSFPEVVFPVPHYVFPQASYCTMAEYDQLVNGRR